MARRRKRRYNWAPKVDGPGTDVPRPITVAVVMRDALLREAIRYRLLVEPDITVVGSFDHVADAIDVTRGRPDVVLVSSLALQEYSAIAPLYLGTAAAMRCLVALPARALRGDELLATELSNADVVSLMDGPDRLLAAIRSTRR